MPARNQKQQNTRQHSNVAEFCDICFGISVQFARKCLYLRTDRKAVFHFLAVLLLSLTAIFVRFPDHYYFVQKDNILNHYFVKLSWFWTCIVVCPFIWHVSVATGQSLFGIILNLSRMVVATITWYYCTHGFSIFERMTGYCHGSKLSPRSSCAGDGGKWVPGFDISGHCFILIYSILIMCEEALAFRHITFSHRSQRTPVQNENLIKIYFLSMCALHLLWDFELLISALYYHHIIHKIMGSLVAILCWYFTYHVWFRKFGVPPLPWQPRKVSR
ncbi:unnamed protein product [Thelazia callipaeda]|uniref:Fat storage-inducing transmembrane protein 2 n=1 Tax=Thelazia callipaeda TaxID=103827 RepID=A0A0N5CRC0_THECL|nr:unnamed protein product [Thelazia callipaeda]